MEHKLIKLSIFILFIFLIPLINHLTLLLGFHITIVTGNSMCPSHGTYGISLQKEIISTNDLKIGKVYVYEDYLNITSYNLIQHRLMDIRGSDYIFKGDNNICAESVPFKYIKYKNLMHISLREC